MKRISFAAVGLMLAACSDSDVIADPQLQSELSVGFVSTESLRIDGLRLDLSSGSWTRTLHGTDFDRHPNNATAFSSGYISIPSGATLSIGLLILQAGDTIAIADLGFPIEAAYSYGLSIYATRDLPGYGGDIAIPLVRRLPGFPSDSIYYRWGGTMNRPAPN